MDRSGEQGAVVLVGEGFDLYGNRITEERFVIIDAACDPFRRFGRADEFVLTPAIMRQVLEDIHGIEIDRQVFFDEEDVTPHHGGTTFFDTSGQNASEPIL